MHAVFLYSLETGKATQITDGMSDAGFPLSTRAASISTSPPAPTSACGRRRRRHVGTNRPVTSSVYIVVLRKDLPSPLAPESDEEKADEKKDERPKEVDAAASAEKPADGSKPDEKKEKKEEPPPWCAWTWTASTSGCLALPIPARTYVDLRSGKTGIVFLAEAPAVVLEPADYNGPRCTSSTCRRARRRR